MSKKEINNLIERPPVVVIMGHIDHGKSTLLDFIRKTNVVKDEAGSITQHISAYEVISGKKKITFIDTPGHAAFSTVRSTGVDIADIAILIISAEDGVKPQTIEAYQDIQKAKIPFIIAINKVDKPNANVQNIKNELIENEIYLEGSGGDIPFVAISAQTGESVSKLLDTIFLVAEMEELKGEKNKLASGFILESKIDKQKGTEITAVIKNGVLKKGNFILIDNKISPIRRLESFSGEIINQASFSSPVKLIGLRDIPENGITFTTYSTKKEAEEAIKRQKKVKPNQQKIPVTETMKDDKEKTKILIIIRTDVFGTIGAIQHEIEKIEHERAIIKVISAEVGDITENDIKMAGAKGDTLIIGFNVKINQQVKDLAERQGVRTIIVNVIYKLTGWLKENIKKIIPKIEVAEKTGLAKVIKIFNKTKNNQILGGKVKEGKLTLLSKVKVLRRNYEIGEGLIINIQSQKIQTKEINEGDEFGMELKSKIDIAPGDMLEAFMIVEK